MATGNPPAPWGHCFHQHHSHRLVYLVGGTSATEPNSSRKEAGQTEPSGLYSSQQGRGTGSAYSKTQGGVSGTSNHNNQQCSKGKERGGSRWCCFSEGVGWENKELFEDGEEDINQVGERLKM